MGLLVVGIITGAAIVGGTVYGAVEADKAEDRARSNKNRLMGELEELELGRQDVINPYAGITDLGSMVTDLSSIASNPYANLSVSTAAAEMQIEEADIALANTLDTLRATGASAGGATALARMALESKKGVSASIQQQEVNNDKLRIDGQKRLEDIEFAEAKRVQSTKINTKERLENKDAAGKIYEFETTEGREMQELNRKQAQITGQAQAEAAASTAKSQVIASGVQGLTNLGASAITKSDRKLKKNINKIGESDSGINIYEFQYIHDDAKFQGVMADEVPYASIEHEDGYSMVDYSLIDVEFKEL